MASQVQICNRALRQIGANVITSINDDTIEAKHCLTFFNEVVDEVLIQGPWTTALRRATLAQNATDPEYGFDSSFQLPTDPFCLRVLNINDEATGVIPFAIEGDDLLIDANTVSIRYIARLTDTQAYGPALTNAIVARLAADLAYPLTGDASIAAKMYERYEYILARMLAIDGQQGSAEYLTMTVLNEVR